MNKQKTRSKILASAIRLFGEKGKSGVSTADIARDAQVNKALIFYYFKSKDELYRTIFKNLMAEFVEKVSQRMSKVEPGLPAVEVFVRCHIALLKENYHMATMIIRELLLEENADPDIKKECSEVFKMLRDDMLRELSRARAKRQIRGVDPLQTIVSIVSLDIFYFLGKPLVKLINPSVDNEKFETERVDHVVDILLNGLREGEE
ncbi:TetR/AcrR family transcriptional regulator [Candidatus Latescibacterota bacterium]